MPTISASYEHSLTRHDMNCAISDTRAKSTQCRDGKAWPLHTQQQRSFVSQIYFGRLPYNSERKDRELMYTIGTDRCADKSDPIIVPFNVFEQFFLK